jgi:predicted amidohydrolase YtcJ
VSVADVVFLNGSVFVADAARRWATAVAVRRGRIAAVGGDEVRQYVGARTQVVDLDGRLLVPGFQDAHVHPGGAGLERLSCDLSSLHSRQEYLDAIAHYAVANRQVPWILGGGWSMDQFPGGIPHRRDLDAVVPDRPVFLPNRDHHAAWVNSSALALAGIDRSTPDPPYGRIERDPDGTPNGTLQEDAAGLVGRLVPAPTAAQLREGLREGQRYLHQHGVTSWQDAIVGTYESVPDTYDAYLEMAAADELTAKVVGALWWDRHRGLDQLDELLDRRLRAGDGVFRATTVKMMLDGVCENLTASMHLPYLDARGRPGPSRGIDFIDQRELARYVTALDAVGFQVHFHAIGDRAVTAALDAVQAARHANGVRDNRHHIAHVQVVRPQDVPRFRELGVTATIQALWACNDPQMTELTLPLLGQERAGWQYPFGAFTRAGVPLAYGSDWPVSSPDPLQAIHVAVNRTEPPQANHGELSVSREVFLPAERVDLASALAGYTIGSAYVNHLDSSTGSIEVGKLADLVVLDRNPFAGPPEEIGNTTVATTYIEGHAVYSADQAG